MDRAITMHPVFSVHRETGYVLVVWKDPRCHHRDNNNQKLKRAKGRNRWVDDVGMIFLAVKVIRIKNLKPSLHSVNFRTIPVLSYLQQQQLTILAGKLLQ